MIRDTTRKTYEEIVAEGYINAKQKEMYEWMLFYQDPLTDLEISLRLGKTINATTPRRGELEAMGLIVDEGIIKNGNNRSVHIWKAVPFKDAKFKILPKQQKKDIGLKRWLK
jgi:hypothetical protein